MWKLFQVAHEKIIHEGWKLDDALTYALNVFNVTYPPTYESDETSAGVFDRDSKAYRNIDTRCWTTT